MQGRREHATAQQSPFALRESFQTAGNDPCHGLVSIANKHLFAVPDELNMRAKLRFQIADIDGSHAASITDMTMLVIFHFSAGNRSPVEAHRIGCCLETSALPGDHYHEHHGQVDHRGMNHPAGQHFRSGLREFGHVI